MGPKSNKWCLYKRTEKGIQTQTQCEEEEEGRLKTETDIGITLPHTKKYQEPSKAGERKNLFSKAVGETMALLIP